MPVGGHVRRDVVQLAVGQLVVADADRARRRADEPGEGAQQLALAVADDAGDADDLAAVGREGDVGEARRPRARRRRAPAARPPAARCLGGKVDSSWRPTIIASSSSSVTSVDVDRARGAAVAQHGDPVGELAHLGEAVGDVDDGGARLRRRRGPGRRAVRPSPGRAARSARRGSAAAGLHGERLGELEQVLLRDAERRRPGPRGGRCNRRRRAAPHRRVVGPAVREEARGGHGHRGCSPRPSGRAAPPGAGGRWRCPARSPGAGVSASTVLAVGR